MAKLLNCAFCEKCDEKLSLFTEETLKKCRVILRQRKIHNLKFKNVVLPVDLFDAGFHRECYKSFTGLNKKYYSQKAATTKKCTGTENSSNIAKNKSTASAPTLPIISTVKDLSPASASNPAVSYLPEPTSSNSEGHCMQLECVVDSLSQSNISLESNISIDKNAQICLFCNQKTKKLRSKRLPLHSTNKNDFLNKLDEENGAFMELIYRVKKCPYSIIYYHNICRLDFFYKTSSKKKTTKTNWHDVRQLHQECFHEMCDFIQENVIKRGRCFFLTYLHRYYMELFEESQIHSEEIIGNFTPNNLENKIVKAFDKKIKFLIIQNKKILAPKHVTDIDDQSFENLKDENILHKAALLLRKSVLQVEKKNLPSNISVCDLQEGEVSVSQDLSEFFSTLIAGSNSKQKKNPKCMQLVQSFCEDVVYGIFNEKFKTSKHIKLGMTLKSLTGNREIIDIIHRYGHCISYSAIEELELEATHFSTQKSPLCSEAIKKTPNLCTDVAFDICDQCVETKSSEDTLHGTVGIIYQNVDPNTPDESKVQNLPSVSSQGTSNLRKRRQRTFQNINVEKEPHPKQLKMIAESEVSVHDEESMSPINIDFHNNIDTIFLIH